MSPSRVPRSLCLPCSPLGTMPAEGLALVCPALVRRRVRSPCVAVLAASRVAFVPVGGGGLRFGGRFTVLATIGRPPQTR